MDLINRKYKFIEQFMKIANAEKLERFEQLLRSEFSKESDIVAYTAKGKPLTKKQYIQQIKDADTGIDSGKFTTVEELEKEVQNW